jgi:hypothetical protein
MSRQAMLLVADEIFYNLVGKAVLQGIYHTDLIIPLEESPIGQLLFYFFMDTSLDDPFRSLAVEVTLPGSPAVQNTVPVVFPIPPAMIQADRTRLYYRHPMLIQAPTLRPGRISAKVIHENGEIIVGAPWIVLTPAAAAAAKAH